MSQQRHPFGIAISKNIKIVEEVLKPYAAKREDIIDTYAVRDEEGNFVGVMIDDPKGVADENGVKPKIRTENPQKINEIEWKDQTALLKELDTLGRQKTSITLYPIDVNKAYLDSKSGKQITIGEYIDQTFEGSLILYLDSFGFWSNLDI